MDGLYHRLFSHPVMVEQLIDAFLPAVREAGAVPAGLERVNAKFHAPGGKRRESDVVWRLPLGGGRDLYLYLMLEFQSAADWWMAVPPDSPLWPWQPRARFHLLDIGTVPNHLLSTDNLAALLFRLEHQHADPAELTALVDAVVRWFRGHPDYGTLRLLFTELVRQAITTVNKALPLPDDLQEMQTMLATQGQRWIEKWTAEGQISGKASVLRRMLTRRFGPLPAEVEARIQAADGPTLDEWCDRILDARTMDEVFGGGAG